MISLARFFLSSGQPERGRIAIFGSDAHQIRRVLRLQPGSLIECVDQGGRIHLVQIDALGSTVTGVVLETSHNSSESPLHLTLFQALVKGDKMDFVVQKAVELGAASVVPFRSSRCVVRVDREQAKTRVERWNRIAVEAAKQCGRTRLPAVCAVHSFSDMTEGLTERRQHNELLVAAYEGEQQCTLRSIDFQPRAVSAIVGPEGGFADHEVEQLVKSGVRTVSLGPRILRTETAGLVLLSLLGYKWGDLA